MVNSVPKELEFKCTFCQVSGHCRQEIVLIHKERVSAEKWNAKHGRKSQEIVPKHNP